MVEIPRDLQSDLHDMADKMGEKVARGQLVEIDYKTAQASVEEGDEPFQLCTCDRYSQVKGDGTVVFWNEPDLDCEYKHLQPLPAIFHIKPA
jgi:hypothetical protein